MKSSLTTPVPSPTQDLRRVIGFFGGTALIVGITIGGGIFRKPPTIAGLVPNPVVIIALWTAFGVISICGALAIAELSSLLPRPGGVYVFLREAYGDAAAFVFGWLYVLVATPNAVSRHPPRSPRSLLSSPNSFSICSAHQSAPPQSTASLSPPS